MTVLNGYHSSTHSSSGGVAAEPYVSLRSLEILVALFLFFANPERFYRLNFL